MTGTYLSDMSVCLPRSNLSEKPKKGCWRLIAYELENLKGTMVWANSKTRAPDIVYPSDLKGWHGIYLGIWDWAWSKVPVMITEGQVEGGNMLKIRLSSDPCFTTVSKEFQDFRAEEFFWKYADLTGKQFVLGQQSEGFSRRACLAFIRVVPLSEEQIEQVRNDRARKDTKRLVAMNDAYSWMYETHPTTVEEIHSQIERYRDTDFGAVFYECGFLGTLGFQALDLEDFPRQGEEFANDSVRTFKGMGVEPIGEVVKYGHTLGLQVFASVRIGIPVVAPPFDNDPQGGGSLSLSHPELTCVERDGSQGPCLSYAFPEVRSRAIKTLQNAVMFGVDGVNPLFHRGPPFLLYEKPLVDGFMARYGEDPRKIPETDERWLKLRAETLTEFMEELREGVNETAREYPREKPKISCVVFPTRADNLRYGIDIEVWVRKALVDYVLARDVLYASWENQPVDVPFFRDLTKGTNCKFYVMLGSASAVYRIQGGTGTLASAYAKKAAALYEEGVAGLAFWDTNLQDRFAATWSGMRRLGHVEEVRSSKQDPTSTISSMPLKKLGGVDVSFRHDAWFYV